MSAIALANPDRIAAEVKARAFAPPPPIDYERFAVDHIVFSKSDSPDFPGPYNPDLFPFFTEILRALGPDDPCDTVSLKKSAQVGGTVVANIFTLGSLVMDTGDVMYIHPTEDNARRWSKMKLRRMMEETDIVRAAFPRNTRDAADSVLYKERRDGRSALLISGANSPSSLSQVTVPRQVQDDLSKWVVNDGGDPEAQADSRSWAVEFSKKFKIGTPLIMPGCRISKNFEDGSQEYLEVPCPHCGHYQALEWENLKTNIEAGHVEDAHFTCLECGCAIEDHHRRAIVRQGRWVARNAKARRRHRSFHLWSAYSPLQTLRRIAYAWLKARGDQSSEQTFLNDVAGLEFITHGEAPPWEEIKARAEHQGYRIGTIPLGGLVTTMGIDVQGDRIEWQAIAHTRNRGCFVIEVGVIDGHIADDAARNHLDSLLKRRWRNAAGREIGLDRVAIDGNAYTDDVLEWARRHPSSLVMMVRGVPKDSAPKLAVVKRERSKSGKIRKYGGRFYNVGTSSFKLRIYHNLAKADPLDVGYIGHPAGLPDDYYRQLTSERRREIRRRTGAIDYEWVPDPKVRNEALDTFVYAMAAAYRLLGPDAPDTVWDRYEAERETPLAAAQLDLEDMMSAPAAPLPAPRPATSQSREDRKAKWKNRT
ncbi:terminase gpA endonuclease subunit [Xanthobacter sp. 91]|uniref:phage terminase large subunit family protein n=1 Tax=Xanthobacter sp. 91 TaxID=1117244 RepID=UPI00068A39FF|nr:terminase gpA endonuclease subunit [Xanthobacter sp. 91]